MAQYGQTKKELHKHKLAPSKKFGQNFLVNKHTAERIASCAQIISDDTIIEVGVGLGALTLPLATRAKKIYGIEIDSGLVTYHQEENDLPENVSLIHGDILKVDFQDLQDKCGSKLKIVANLPYSISNPFLFKLIENVHYLESATIMFQKEVADRLLAKTGTKQYGIPTVLLQSCGSVEKLMTLKPVEFHPRPKIDSVVVRLQFSPVPERVKKLQSHDRKLLSKIIRSTFGNRRKTLLNTMTAAQLFTSLNVTERHDVKELTEKVILNAGIAPSIRAENLHLEDFVKLAVVTEKILQGK
jgi:16S rRNA (adenine1518-N6/adenine1519-N6)-dimethyltransferase